MKSFIFLYPIQEYFDCEVERFWLPKAELREFRQMYKDILNKCIDARYRQKGFSINYAIFDDCEVSEVIDLEDNDNTIKVGLDFKTHVEEEAYPDNDFILDQLGRIKTIRIAGFHLWDCVDRLAERAHERNLNVLVDEDLTEFFVGRLSELRDGKLKIDEYPSYRPREEYLGMFMEERMEKPWLWQEY